MVTEVPSSFIIQYIAGSDLFREASAYEQVVILERMFAARAKKCLLFSIMKLPMAIKENAF